jgi:hypothetical protein
MEVHLTPEGEARLSKSPVMPVRIPSGWWAVAENSSARAWENSLTGAGQFELVGVLRLRNRSAARSSCSAQDDKIFQFRGNTVSATVPW